MFQPHRLFYLLYFPDYKIEDGIESKKLKTEFMKEEIHVGKWIKKKMEESGRKVTWLAQKLNCNRNNIYDIYKRVSINTDMLMEICNCLNINPNDCYFEQKNEENIEKNDRV